MIATTTHTVTRKAVSGGKFEYRLNGEIVTARSGRVYTAASLYINHNGKLIAFLHARADLAVKGSSEANRINTWSRAGWAEITEA